MALFKIIKSGKVKTKWKVKKCPGPDEIIIKSVMNFSLFMWFGETQLISWCEKTFVFLVFSPISKKSQRKWMKSIIKSILKKSNTLKFYRKKYHLHHEILEFDEVSSATSPTSPLCFSSAKFVHFVSFPSIPIQIVISVAICSRKPEENNFSRCRIVLCLTSYVVHSFFVPGLNGENSQGWYRGL